MINVKLWLRLAKGTSCGGYLRLSDADEYDENPPECGGEKKKKTIKTIDQCTDVH